jgi:hypothetical protein
MGNEVCMTSTKSLRRRMRLKISRPVLNTDGVGDNPVEFNLIAAGDRLLEYNFAFAPKFNNALQSSS